MNKLFSLQDCEDWLNDGADTEDGRIANAIVRQLADTMRENGRLREALGAIESISNEDYKTGGFLTGEIPDNWAELGLADAKTLARAELEDQQHKEPENGN